jgi:hypothetical protein
MLDPEVAACACVGARAAHGTAAVPAVRDLALRRRRSKIPWMYAVYHAARPAPEAAIGVRLDSLHVEESRLTPIGSLRREWVAEA